jgi:hypothetical protein
MVGDSHPYSSHRRVGWLDSGLMKIKFKAGQIASDVDSLSYFPIRVPVVVELTDEQADHIVGEVILYHDPCPTCGACRICEGCEHDKGKEWS